MSLDTANAALGRRVRVRLNLAVGSGLEKVELEVTEGPDDDVVSSLSPILCTATQ